MFSGTAVPWEPPPSQSSGRSVHGLKGTWLKDGGLKGITTFCFCVPSVAQQDMSQEKRWGMSWLLHGRCSCLRKARVEYHMGAAWMAWCYFLHLGLLFLHCLFATDGDLAGFPSKPQPQSCCRTCQAFLSQKRSQLASTCLQQLCTPGWNWPLGTAGWLAAETVPKGRNACPLSLQTLTLSCAGPLLGPEEDPAAERAGWE